jgi:signal peptidase I
MLPWLKRHLYSVLSICALLGILPGYLWPYSLSGASAAPTVLVRDTIIVNRAAYDLRLPYSRIRLLRIGSPRRGDIVLAQLPDVVRPAFKRVIGLPGETIEVRENRVIVDGRPLPVQPLPDSDFSWVPPAHRMGSVVVMEDGHWAAYTPGKSPDRNSPPVRLAPGEYFLMGDNRDNSLDSRAFGPISRDSIMAKALLILPTGPRVATR